MPNLLFKIKGASHKLELTGRLKRKAGKRSLMLEGDFLTDPVSG